MDPYCLENSRVLELQEPVLCTNALLSKGAPELRVDGVQVRGASGALESSAWGLEFRCLGLEAAPMSSHELVNLVCSEAETMKVSSKGKNFNKCYPLQVANHCPPLKHNALPPWR